MCGCEKTETRIRVPEKDVSDGRMKWGCPGRDYGKEVLLRSQGESLQRRKGPEENE